MVQPIPSPSPQRSANTAWLWCRRWSSFVSSTRRSRPMRPRRAAMWCSRSWQAPTRRRLPWRWALPALLAPVTWGSAWRCAGSTLPACCGLWGYTPSRDFRAAASSSSSPWASTTAPSPALPMTMVSPWCTGTFAALSVTASSPRPTTCACSTRGRPPPTCRLPPRRRPASALAPKEATAPSPRFQCAMWVASPRQMWVNGCECATLSPLGSSPLSDTTPSAGWPAPASSSRRPSASTMAHWLGQTVARIATSRAPRAVACWRHSRT